MEYQCAIFIVTEEDRCPIYNVGEEFRVDGRCIMTPEAKGACLTLTREIIHITAGTDGFSQMQKGREGAKFECGGCYGMIRFEFKQEKEFHTVQMKLLAAADERRKARRVEKLSGLLRRLGIFETMSFKNLRDLSTLLQERAYMPNELILKKGEPGTSLYMILEGKVSVLYEGDEILTELGPGDVFGEMSLLSGEPVTRSVYVVERSQIATLDAKNFKVIMNQYPELQVYFYKILVDRATNINAQRETSVSADMTGELMVINSVELFQLINTSQKTGRVTLSFDKGGAEVLFNQGEIILAKYGKLMGKEAVFAILSRKEGSFQFSAGISAEAEQLPVVGGFMGLIMEGMRRVDEFREKYH